MTLEMIDKSFLMEQLKKITFMIENMDMDIHEIKGSQFRMEKKMNDIYSLLSEMSTYIQDIKQESRSIDEKISLMSFRLDKIKEVINEDEGLEQYIYLSQQLFTYWDQLDELTKKYIPVAEYLYSQLQKQPDMDYSPVILEYCRAIENELLAKLFKDFAIEIIQQKGTQLDSYLMDDLRDKNTNIFAQILKRSKHNLAPRFTLGEMQKILTFLTKTHLTRNSPLLQDFNVYLSKKFNTNRLLHNDFLMQIRAIVNDYRNKSAHIAYLNLQDAENCKKIIPPHIDYIFESEVN